MGSEFSTAPKLVKRSSQSSITKAQEQFLQLHLVSDTIALMPTKDLSEVLTFSAEQIMPMPHMSPWMMGTYNWRGEILWLLDLGYLVGLTPLYKQVLSSYTATVLQFPLSTKTLNNTNNQIVGLVVNQVGNIERCHPQSIKPSSFFAKDTKLEKFLRGYWLKSEQDILAVFDPDAIWREISQS